MLDMSWGEVMVIGAVALIVIGPKDLPKALRTLGNMTSKIRRMAAEFQGQFNEAMREAELDDVKKQLEGMNDSVSSIHKGTLNPIQTIRDELKGAIERPRETPSALPPSSNVPTVDPLESFAPPFSESEPAQAGMPVFDPPPKKRRSPRTRAVKAEPEMEPKSKPQRKRKTAPVNPDAKAE